MELRPKSNNTHPTTGKGREMQTLRKLFVGSIVCVVYYIAAEKKEASLDMGL